MDVNRAYFNYFLVFLDFVEAVVRVEGCVVVLRSGEVTVVQLAQARRRHFVSSVEQSQLPSTLYCRA